MQRHFVVHVVDVAVQADVHAVSDQLGLRPHVRRKLVAIVGGTRRLASGICDDVFEVLVHGCVLGTVEPDLVPIFLG